MALSDAQTLMAAAATYIASDDWDNAYKSAWQAWAMLAAIPDTDINQAGMKFRDDVRRFLEMCKVERANNSAGTGARGIQSREVSYS